MNCHNRVTLIATVERCLACEAVVNRANGWARLYPLAVLYRVWKECNFVSLSAHCYICVTIEVI